MSTLADLYDPTSAPSDLIKAHEELDRAVEKSYRPELFHSDRERIEHLFRLHEKLSAPLLPTVDRKPQGRRPAKTSKLPPVHSRTPGLPAVQHQDALDESVRAKRSVP